MITTATREFWLMSERPDVIRRVEAAVRSCYSGSVMRTATSLGQLEAALRQSHAPIAIVDLPVNPSAHLAQMGPIINDAEQTRFIVIVDAMPQELLLESMTAGVRRMVQTATIEAELPRAIQKLLGSAMADPGQRGSAIALLSAGGGCGATTLAVNLAIDLPHSDNEPVLLIDMDSAYGAAATYLGVRGQYSLAQVLGAGAAVDPQLVLSTAVKVSTSLHVMLNPVSVNPHDPQPLQLEHLTEALDACKRAYRWVVIDAPRVPLRIAAQLARACGSTLIVGQLSVKDVRMARTIHNGLVDYGIAPTSLRYVINRYRGRHQISLDDARNVWGDGQVELAHNDFAVAAQSVNMGRTLPDIAPRSTLRRDIQHLAETVAGNPVNGNGHGGH